MRVTAENSCESSCCGIEIKRVKIVEQVEVQAAKRDNLCLRQHCAWSMGVNVTADCGDRSDCLERLKNADIADIATMQDVIGAVQ